MSDQPDYLDAEADAILAKLSRQIIKFVLLGLLVPWKRRQWKNDAMQTDRQLSQWIQHGRISPECRSRLTKEIQQIEWLYFRTKYSRRPRRYDRNQVTRRYP